MQCSARHIVIGLYAAAVFTRLAYADIQSVEFKSVSNSRTTPQFQARAMSDGFLLDSTVRMMPAGSDERILRLDSSLTTELDSLSSGLRIGDAVSRSDSIGSNLRFGGLLLSTQEYTPDGNRAAVSAVGSTCDKYAFGLGRKRLDYGVASARYGTMLANATVGCALNSSTKLELHGEREAGKGTTSGIAFTKSLSKKRKIAVALANSHSIAGQGWQARFKFEQDSEYLQLRLNVNFRDMAYRDSTSRDNTYRDSAYLDTGAIKHAAAVWQRVVTATVSTPLKFGFLPYLSIASLSFSSDGASDTQGGVVTLRQQLTLMSRRTISLMAASSLENISPTLKIVYSHSLAR